MKDRLTLLLVSVLCSGVSYAQAPEQKDSIDVRIYFKQGSSVIDMKFKDNQNRLYQYGNCWLHALLSCVTIPFALR